MLNKCLSYLLLSLIALQSVATVADAHSLQQSSNQHVNISHSDVDLRVAAAVGLGADRSAIDTPDTASSAAESLSDCTHCCHCHGSVHAFLMKSVTFTVPVPVNTEFSVYRARHLAVVANPAFRPPIC